MKVVLSSRADQILHNFVIKKQKVFLSLQADDLQTYFFGLESKRLPRLIGD